MFYLVVVMFSLGFSIEAQSPSTFFYDFEDAGVDLSRFRSPDWTGNTVERTANPLSGDAVNPSEFVFKMTHSGANMASNGGFMMMDLNQRDQVTDVSQYNRLRFKIYRGGITQSEVAIQYDGAGDNLPPVEPLSEHDGWQVVEFEIAPKNYNALAFRLLLNSVGNGESVYIDELEYYTASATSIDAEELTGAVELVQTGQRKASLRFPVLTEGKAKVEVYSMQGELVQQVVNSRLYPGNYSFVLSFPSRGIYVVSLDLNGSRIVRKCLIQ